MPTITIYRVDSASSCSWGRGAVYGRSTDSFFGIAAFRFHGPDGFETDYAGLTGYFTFVRVAFDDLSILWSMIVVESDHIACQTWIEATFMREFAPSLPPSRTG